MVLLVLVPVVLPVQQRVSRRSRLRQYRPQRGQKQTQHKGGKQASADMAAHPRHDPVSLVRQGVVDGDQPSIIPVRNG